MLIMRYDACMHPYDVKGLVMNCFNFFMNVDAKKRILTALGIYSLNVGRNYWIGLFFSLYEWWTVEWFVNYE